MSQRWAAQMKELDILIAHAEQKRSECIESEAEYWRGVADGTRMSRDALYPICGICKGIGAPWNNSSSISCSNCHGTGRKWAH